MRKSGPHVLIALALMAESGLKKPMSQDSPTTPKMRESRTEDSEFVYQAKKTSLGEQIGLTYGWDEDFQRRYHKEHFDPAGTQIVVCQGSDVGWIEVSRKDERITIVDICILPEFQNMGLGSFILRSLLKEAKERGLIADLGVFKTNPRAKRLYERLGFVVVKETETHYLMEAP